MKEELRELLPFWEKLTDAEQELLVQAVTRRTVRRGEVLHSGSNDCVGLLLVTSGQLRAYTLSQEGREITLYRLFERDMCLFSASCMLSSIHFEVMVAAERNSEYLHIPVKVYEQLMHESVAVANYTNELMASRFSDVMWLLDQILYKKLDARLAALLLEEHALTGERTLHVTHEALANHLGSAREVVTRMLGYFGSEGLVQLMRGTVTLVDLPRLRALAEDSLR